LAQNQALTSVTVLGNKVGITYGSKLTDAQRLAASDAIGAAAGLLNKNASSLTADEKKAIGQISSDLPPAFVHVRIRQFSVTPSPV
jgi:hypothetical protein